MSKYERHVFTMAMKSFAKKVRLLFRDILIVIEYVKLCREIIEKRCRYIMCV